MASAKRPRWRPRWRNRVGGKASSVASAMASVMASAMLGNGLRDARGWHRRWTPREWPSRMASAVASGQCRPRDSKRAVRLPSLDGLGAGPAPRLQARSPVAVPRWPRGGAGPATPSAQSGFRPSMASWRRRPRDSKRAVWLPSLDGLGAGPALRLQARNLVGFGALLDLGASWCCSCGGGLRDEGLRGDGLRNGRPQLLLLALLLRRWPPR